MLATNFQAVVKGSLGASAIAGQAIVDAVLHLWIGTVHQVLLWWARCGRLASRPRSVGAVSTKEHAGEHSVLQNDQVVGRGGGVECDQAEQEPHECLVPTDPRER